MRGAKQKEMFEISDMRRKEILLLRSVFLFVPQGGYTQIFSYIRRPGLFLGGGIQNFEFQYFWGYEDFVDIFLGHHRIGLYLEVISMHLSVKVQNGGYFWGC